MRHMQPIQAELFPHPREGLCGIKDCSGADDEAFAGQMRRRVTCYPGGNQSVPSHKKDVVQVLYSDHLCVRQFRQHSPDQVL